MLLDVTGATSELTVKEKAGKITENTKEVQDALHSTGLTRAIGVLLAPNHDESVGDGTAVVVQGADARDLLGGLQQLLTYLGDLED